MLLLAAKKINNKLFTSYYFPNSKLTICLQEITQCFIINLFLFIFYGGTLLLIISQSMGINNMTDQHLTYQKIWRMKTILSLYTDKRPLAMNYHCCHLLGLVLLYVVIIPGVRLTKLLTYSLSWSFPQHSRYFSLHLSVTVDFFNTFWHCLKKTLKFTSKS